jgi:tetratricopeptide (TPR) repeat protein
VKEGKWKTALADFEVAVDLGSGLSLPYASRAAELSRRGEYDVALGDCNEAIGIDPGCLSYSTRGDVYLSMGETDAAIVDLRRATEIDKDCACGYHSLAIAHYRAGDETDAIEACKKCLAILTRYGDDWTVYDVTALKLQCEGRDAEAIEEYTKSLERQPYSAGCFSRRGDAYYRLGEAERARDDWRRAHEIDHSYPVFAYARRAIGIEGE